MSWIDFASWDTTALAGAWRRARPFPHVVIDGLVPEPRLRELREAVAREAHTPNLTDFYELMGSAEKVAHPTLQAFERSLAGPEALAAVAAITGKPVGRVEMRSYVYLAGSFLLPHSDCRDEIGRLVAYAYYLLPRESSVGGELELFACDMDGGELRTAEPALRIEPRENRVVIFEVSPSSLHQVREVTGGGRVSLSGWYLA